MFLRHFIEVNDTRFGHLLLRQRAGVELDGGSYLIHKVYDDEETLRLVGATTEILGNQPVMFNA